MAAQSSVQQAELFVWVCEMLEVAAISMPSVATSSTLRMTHAVMISMRHAGCKIWPST